MRICTLIGAAFSLLIATAAADNQNHFPPVSLPDPLKPYADETKTIDGATEVLHLLSTARFDEPQPRPTQAQVDSKPTCASAEVASFYRGLTLVQAAYFMFISKTERGYEAVESPHPLGGMLEPLPQSFGALVRPGRELLVTVWNAERIERLLNITSDVRTYPPAVKADLVTYFTELLAFAGRYDALKRRAPTDLAKLQRRTTELYMYQRRDILEDAKRKGGSAVHDAEVEHPEWIFYDAYSKEMRLLLDANRDLGQQTVSECLDGGHFAAVHFGEKAEITYDPYGLYPTSYMIGFWERRASEGTSNLARFAITKLLAELKREAN